jgi:hypothetical protein
MSLELAVVCGSEPEHPEVYFLRAHGFESAWEPHGPGWDGEVSSVVFHGRPASSARDEHIASIARCSPVWILELSGRAADEDGWAIARAVAEEIAIDTGGVIVSTGYERIDYAPTYEDAAAARTAAADARGRIDGAVTDARKGDGEPLAQLAADVLAQARAGRTRARAIVAHALREAVAASTASSTVPSSDEGAFVAIAKEALTRLGADLDVTTENGSSTPRRPAPFPTVSDPAAVCLRACAGDPEALDVVREWARRYPPRQLRPLGRDVARERLAFVGPFCEAVRRAPSLHPTLADLAVQILGTTLLESGGTLAALRAKLPREVAKNERDLLKRAAQAVEARAISERRFDHEPSKDRI